MEPRQSSPSSLSTHSQNSIEEKGSGGKKTGTGVQTSTDDTKHEIERQISIQDNIKNGDETNAKLANPLKGLSREEVVARARAFAVEAGLEDMSDTFAKAGLIARDPMMYETMSELSEEDKEVLRREESHRWEQPKRLYLLVICCSMSAVVQGIDQSVINGANLFYPATFGIVGQSDWLIGIINSAPYFSCALLASWVTEPLNHYFGRRGAIFISCSIAMLTCIWSGLVHTWWHLIIARVFLGFGIAPKSATVPVYAAETVPASIRGGLVMQWQLWTAFGIMLGYVADLAFYNVPDMSGIDGLNWRLMLGSAAIPPIFVLVLVYMSPESPRWYMYKGRLADSYHAMAQLRNTPLQAARDVYLAYEGVLVEREASRNKSRSRLVELFTVPRIRKGTQSASFVMFMQQFCGVNVVAYFSSTIFQDAGASEIVALGASLGWGSLNWLMGIPAIWTIDRIGRRGLLLIGFPLMSLFLFWTGFSFYIDPTNPESSPRLAMVAMGTYLHCMAYSPTAGPVPFTYSAESFPLAHRTIGMTWAVAICWFFNGVLSLTFPALTTAFTNTGAFCWYAAWNLFGAVYTYFLLPETSSLTLEELDAVFSVTNARHASFYAKKLPWYLRRALKGKVGKTGPVEYSDYLYVHERLSREEREALGGTFAPAAAGH